MPQIRARLTRRHQRQTKKLNLHLARPFSSDTSSSINLLVSGKGITTEIRSWLIITKRPLLLNVVFETALILRIIREQCLLTQELGESVWKALKAVPGPQIHPGSMLIAYWWTSVIKFIPVSLTSYRNRCPIHYGLSAGHEICQQFDAATRNYVTQIGW